MGMTIEKSELNTILKLELEKIFENKTFRDLSNFQRRQCVFNYLVKSNGYDFSLLNDIYSGKKREYADEIISVLNPEAENKGTCNGFSYAYKLLLDKLQIPCMLAICYILEDSVKWLQDKGINTDTSIIERDSTGRYMIPHMLVLVQNDDGTFSFDDITYAIFNKGTGREQDYFNYNYQTAEQSRQVNLEGFDTVMLRGIVENSIDTTNDEVFREKYGKPEDEAFLTIPIDLIKSYKEPSKAEDLEEIR